MKLPESWVETTVGKVVVDLQPGFAQKPGEDDEGMTPQIRTHNISPNGKITLDGIKHVSASAKELKRYVLTRGDVVFNNTNSEEWVGKTAVFNQDGEYVFSNHMTRLRADEALVTPEYLAGYLQLLWSMGYSKTRAKRWVSQAGIEGSALASFKIPLPTLPEQQRIVNVMQRANELSEAKRTLSDQIDQLIRTAYWKYFSDWYTAEGLREPVRIVDYLLDTQYGVSEAMEERGTHAVLRMNSLTKGGWLDLSELKYANLAKKDADTTALQNGDLLFNRTNSKELVGKCAIWRDAPELFSFASYLVRLRLREGMLPEYLWATLNSAYGKYRLINAAKQAVSMANVSPTDLGRITVPLPPLRLQEKFARFVRKVEELRAQMLNKLDSFEAFRNLVVQQTLIGDLTEEWRIQHHEEISDAEKLRDAALRKRGAKIAPPQKVAKPTTREKEDLPKSRHWLLAELSEFQRQVLHAFLTYPDQPLLAEDPDVFAGFCESEALGKKLAAFPLTSPNHLRRTLSQLAALGLIAKVSVPKTDPTTGKREYLTAFRPLRPGEQTREADLGVVLRSLGLAARQDGAEEDT